MNWNGKYVSVFNIIAKAYRDMGMADEINISDAVEWAGEALEFIGAPYQLIEKTTVLNVENYRAKIPCELHYLETAAGVVLEDLSDECNTDSLKFTPMRYSTDAFHHWRCKYSNDSNCTSSLTYKINDNYIFPNFETGKILLSFRAIPTDDNGYPLVPDDIKFRSAVASEIKWHLAFIKWTEGKMRDAVYSKYEQERDWYIGAAQTRSVTPSIDMAESIKNNWLRLIPKINQHADGFASAGEAEQRYTHNSVGSTGESNSSSSENTFFNNGQPFIIDPNNPPA